MVFLGFFLEGCSRIFPMEHLFTTQSQFSFGLVQWDQQLQIFSPKNQREGFRKWGSCKKNPSPCLRDSFSLFSICCSFLWPFLLARKKGNNLFQCLWEIEELESGEGQSLANPFLSFLYLSRSSAPRWPCAFSDAYPVNKTSVFSRVRVWERVCR